MLTRHDVLFLTAGSLFGLALSWAFVVGVLTGRTAYRHGKYRCFRELVPGRN
jgi:hypothetical protein